MAWPLAPGARLGRYVLGDQLGEGGMAVVYRATDETLRREVAIKVLSPRVGRAAEPKGRFLREARAVAALDHPNILKVFDVGEEDGLPFLVMELIEGETLADWLRARGAPLGELAAMLGVVLAQALAAAHVAGVIHRDVKPANVMITRRGRVVLCDFGVAHLADDDAIATQSGFVLGTPAFMSPEQAQGRRVDWRTDVYALGATLYHVATGQPPYSGTTPSVLGQVARGELVPPGRRNPALGPGLGKEILRAMAREPDERHADAPALGAALAAIAAVPGLGEPADALVSYFNDPAAWNARALPFVIEAALARGEAALARREVARALAECDRVLTLSPGNERAAALVARVQRGHAWRRWIVGGAFASALCAGGVIVVQSLAGTGTGAVADTGTDTGSGTVAGTGTDTGTVAGTGAVVGTDTGTGAVADAGTDAGTARGRAAPGTPHGRAASGSSKIEAGASSAVDAGPLPDAAPIMAAAPALLTVAIGPYCDLAIDGVAHGRSPRAAAIVLPPGRHELVCTQAATGLSLRRTLELAPGEHRTVRDTLVPVVDVRLAITADTVLIDGVRHARGAIVRVSVGRHRFELPGRPAGYLDVPSRSCTLRDVPELACETTAP